MNNNLCTIRGKKKFFFIFLRSCGKRCCQRIIIKCGYLLVGLLSVLALIVEARDLGKMGHTFEIKEEGFLAMINRKLKNLNIAEEEKKMQEIARKKIEEPEAVMGITRVKEHRSFTYDPTYILREDIKLPDGTILYAAGTKVNPLDHMEFDRKLYFIDARDKKQVAWLKLELKEKGQPSAEEKEEKEKEEKRIILVGGRPIDLAQDLGENIYFDQFGELTNKFGIIHVPAIACQEKEAKVLRIEEVYIDG